MVKVQVSFQMSPWKRDLHRGFPFPFQRPFHTGTCTLFVCTHLDLYTLFPFKIRPWNTPVMTIEDFDFHFDDRFESHLFMNW